MIWLRSTYYDPKKGPVTVVMPKDGINQDIHVMANELREKFGRRTDVEIFEWEDNLVTAAAEAEVRSRTRIPEKQHFKDTLHDFLIATFFKMPPTTTIAPGNPAPVATADVKAIFEAVKQHPLYKNRSIRVQSTDGGVVWMTGGDISVR